MNKIIILHNCVDKNDPQGRTIKEINLEKQHNIPIGSLVEFGDGCRLWVVYHGRDCNGTPLYCLCAEKDNTECTTRCDTPWPGSRAIPKRA